MVDVREDITLVRVGATYGAISSLYDMLKARMDEPEYNISHRTLPSWSEHTKFVRRKPYDAWYLIRMKGQDVGNIYLTKLGEIGIYISPAYRGEGYGPGAIKMLMKTHKRKRYLANINPKNDRSIKMFKRFGFHHIQNTYEVQDVH